MGEEFIFNLLSNVGIPAAVCFYTLHGVNKTLKEQDKTFKELTGAINRQTSDFNRRFEKQADDIKEIRLEVKSLQRKE